MERPELPAKVKDFCREKAINGFTVEETAHMLKTDNDFGQYSEEAVRDYLGRESTQQQIGLEKSIQEKKAQVDREDLIRELKEQKDYIIQQRERLEGSNDEISDQQTKNLLKAIRQLGELIDVLESKEEMGANNVVHVNKLEQNVNIAQSVQYMPKEDKRDIVEQLEDDPDVEDFAVVKKKDAAQENEEEMAA